MRAGILAGLLTAVTGLLSVEAHAALTPTIEFQEGALASVPVTGGSISGAGLTATGAPLIGNPTQAILQFGGVATLGALFNPLHVSVTEFNLTSLGALNSFAAAISGMLPPSSSLSWAAYADPANTPFGTADLIASGGFTDPSPVISLGFSNSVPQAGNLSGPFALTELLTITGPAGDALSFNSSISATSNTVPEPAPLAVLGVSPLGLGLVASRRGPWRTMTAQAAANGL
jgi:hypothetical protein